MSGMGNCSTGEGVMHVGYGQLFHMFNNSICGLCLKPIPVMTVLWV